MSVPGVEGFRLGGRHVTAARLAERHAAELAAADGCLPVAFLVAEYRCGDWLFGDEWAIRFHDVAEAREYAQRVRPPYQVGILAVVPVDGGRLYGGEVR